MAVVFSLARFSEAFRILRDQAVGLPVMLVPLVLMNMRSPPIRPELAAVCVEQSQLFEPLLETKTETFIEMPDSYLANSNRMKERMMKLKILGAAVTLALAAGPAMAKQVISSRGHYAQSIYCATREAGNPYSKYCDYIAWSGWRRRGGWDSRLDDACWRNPGHVPSGCF
jgi:hypothetical protein